MQGIYAKMFGPVGSLSGPAPYLDFRFFTAGLGDAVPEFKFDHGMLVPGQIDGTTFTTWRNIVSQFNGFLIAIAEMQHTTLQVDGAFFRPDFYRRKNRAVFGESEYVMLDIKGHAVYP